MEKAMGVDRYGHKPTDVNPHEYDGAPTSYKVQILRPFVQRLATNSQILDLAAGKGQSANFFDIHGLKTVTMDLSRDMLANHTNQNRVRGFLDLLPFKSKTFEAIHFKDALLHVPNRSKLLGETFRILKPGGELLMVTNTAGYPLPNFETIARSTGKIKRYYFLKEVGYLKKVERVLKEDKDVKQVGPPYYPFSQMVLHKEIQKAGFKVNFLGSWQPDRFEGDWYSVGSGRKRIVYSLFKPG